MEVSSEGGEAVGRRGTETWIQPVHGRFIDSGRARTPEMGETPRHRPQGIHMKAIRHAAIGARNGFSASIARMAAKGGGRK